MSETPEMVAEEMSAQLQNEQAEQAQQVEQTQPVEQAQPVEQVEQPKAKKQKKVKKPWPVPVRILMGLIAFVLCVAMFVVSVAGVLILDIRTVVSRDGISQIISMLVSRQPVSGPARPALAVGAGVYMDEVTVGGEMSGALVDWAYGMLQQEFGDQLQVTKEQVQTFVEESTVKDFVADKVGGIVEDFYTGESETTITKEEIVELIQENKEVLEEQFELVINEEAIQIVEVALEESQILEPIEEQGLLGYIQQSVASGMSPALPGMGGILKPDTPGEGDGFDDMYQENIGQNPGNTVGAVDPMETVTMIMDIVRTATSYEAVAVLAGAFLLLMLLLFLVTHFSFPATLADTGVVLLLVGLIFSIPTAICQYNPELVNFLLPQPAGGIVTLIFHATSGVNYTVLGVGFGLIVLSIVLKIILSVRAKKA